MTKLHTAAAINDAIETACNQLGKLDGISALVGIEVLRYLGTDPRAVRSPRKEEGAMPTLISNVLFIAAVIGGPILLGLLYIYGMRGTREKDKHPHSRDATERATKTLYEQSDAEREHQEKAAEGSKNVIDVIKRKTGTTG